MSKFVNTIIGGAEIAAGAALDITGVGAGLGNYLIAAGVGTVISGLGTLLSGTANGFGTTLRDPTGPWEYIYGERRTGGTAVYINSWGGPNEKMLDMIIIVAAHPCEAVKYVLFDQQRLSIQDNTSPKGAAASAGVLNGSGTSYTPVQQTTNISNITRVNGVVTVTLEANIPPLQEGDPIVIRNVTGDYTLNGTFPVVQILSQVSGDPGSIKFTYLSGGTNSDVDNEGTATTAWADYGRKVYFEMLLGNQTLGQTFIGMGSASVGDGTPYDGDMNNAVSPDFAEGLGDWGGLGFIQEDNDVPNPWFVSNLGVSDYSLENKTAVFLRLHYNDTYFRGGLPQISFIVQGKNNILDPRVEPLGTLGYTANAALCIADYLALRADWGGFGLTYGTQIPYADLVAAANTCDEQVPLAISTMSPPVTENAYECNIKFDLTKTRGEILKNMLTSCAGRITDYGGQYRIWPAAWVGNSLAIGSNPGGGVIPLGNFVDIAAGPMTWDPTLSGRDLYNGVKGTYVAKSNGYMATDFPPYAQDALHGYTGPSPDEGDANLAADGGDRRWLDIQLPGTTSSSCAQRLAKIELLRRRPNAALVSGISRTRQSGTMILNMVAYQAATLDLMVLTVPLIDLSAFQTEVKDVRLRIVDGKSEEGGGPAFNVELDVVEITPDAYEWDTTEELSPEGYPQPAIPGIGGFSFFPTETVPGVSIPFPWSPAYDVPLIGDAVYTGPVSGSPPASQAKATFGLAVQYETDNSGNPIVALEIQGTPAINQLIEPLYQLVGFGISDAGCDPPGISCTAGTSGNLPPGTYIVAASVNAGGGGLPIQPTPLSTPQAVTIPVTSPPANNGSIEVEIVYPAAGDNVTIFGAQVYMGLSIGGSGKAGYYAQGPYISNSPPVASVTYTITDFNQSTPGAPDGSLDHYAIAWKKGIHDGIWAEQVQAVTSDSITFAQGPSDAAMTLNQWADYRFTLLGKLDSTQELIVLNMLAASSTASTGSSPGPPEFTVTFGVNAAGDSLPDLTTLLTVGDLIVCRGKYTFTPSSFSDLNVANPYYPKGATNIEAGHVAIVLDGPDAGDVQSIGSVATDINGNSTNFLLAGRWLKTPNAGDTVIIAEAQFGPEFHSISATMLDYSTVPTIAAPQIPNFAGQTWVVIVRTQNADSDNGLDLYAPIREIYVFGSQGTRTVESSCTMLATDKVVIFEDLSAAATYYCLPFAGVPNQDFTVENADSTYTVTIQCSLSAEGTYEWGPAPGNLTVGTEYSSLLVTTAGTPVQVFAAVAGAPVGSALDVSILRNGGAWCSVVVPAGAFVSNLVTSGLAALALDDLLTIDITAVGSVNPGSNLLVFVTYDGEGDTIDQLTSIVLQPGQSYSFKVPGNG